jgi:hypothetical protein
MQPGHHIDPSASRSAADQPVPAPNTLVIHYLKRKDIDIARWDACVETAANSLIYNRSAYLDAMTAGQWDAFVLEDYQAVMPLTWRRKAGIRYLYQPAFTQQTGISFAKSLSTGRSPALTVAFLQELNRHFRFAEICLNYGNESPIPSKDYPIPGSPRPVLQTRTNFILPLDSPYDSLAANYKKDLTRNLKAAARSELQYVRDFDLRTALDHFRREYDTRLPAITAEDYRHFEELCLLLQPRGQVLTRAAIGTDNEPLCTSVLLRDSSRLYLLHSTTLPAGRPTEANHFLLDQLIREYAATPMILDFEGSDHPGIAHFYGNFGGINQPYFFYRHNRLPWPLRWLK